jgi:small conductance mechanosensitive channel
MMLVLSELGVSVAPILGTDGVVGLAVGFGAQSLVKDC